MPAVLPRQQPIAAAAPATHHVERLDRRLVVDVDVVLDAGLADEAEAQRRAASRHVLAQQRGEAEGAVGVGVDVVADAEVAQVEQAYGDGARALLRHALGADVGQHPFARLGQRLAEAEDPVELRGVATGAPLRVVEVLAAPGVVGADGLQVAVGVGRDPHVLPRRRDDEVLAALHLLGVEAVAVLVEVDEALAGPAAGPAGLVGERTPQSRHAVNLANGPCLRRHPEGGLLDRAAAISSNACRPNATRRASSTDVDVERNVSIAAAIASSFGHP